MKVPTRHPDHVKHLWLCDASDHDFLTLEWWDDKDGTEPFLMVAAFTWPRRWRDRVKTAGRALGGHQVPQHEVLLTYNDAQELQAALAEVKWKGDRPTSNTDNLHVLPLWRQVWRHITRDYSRA